MVVIFRISMACSDYTGCFKKSFTTLKVYKNLYRGHTQRFGLSKCSKTHRVLPRIVTHNCFDLRQVGGLPHYQWKSHWTITIRGKTRCVLLHFDSSERCVCPLYACKVVSYLGEVHEYLNTHFPGRWTVTVEVPWRRNRKKRSKQLRITIRGKTWCVLLHFDRSKRCVCPLYKFLYTFKVVKLFLKHLVYTDTFGRRVVSIVRKADLVQVDDEVIWWMKMCWL
jgi:hypothetical protein